MFTLSSSTSIIIYIGASIINEFTEDAIPTALCLVVDQMVTVWSLFLQFAVMQSVYVKCCSYPDACCQWFVSRKVRLWQEKRLEQPLNPQAPRSNVAVHSQSSSNSPALVPPDFCIAAHELHLSTPQKSSIGNETGSPTSVISNVKTEWPQQNMILVESKVVNKETS